MRGFILYGLGLGFFALLVFGWLQASKIKIDVEKRFPPIGQFVDVQNGRVHLVDIGDKKASSTKTIVLLHGATSNLRDMTSSIGIPLSTDFRVIAIDRPGHGWSSRNGAEDAKLAFQAKTVSQTLEKLGVSEATIVGHSWAGALVMKLALDYPKLTRSIVLISPVTHTWPGGIAWYHRLVTTPVFGDIFTRDIAIHAARFLMPKAVDAVFMPSAAPKNYMEKTGVELILRPEEFKANSQDLQILYDQVAIQAPLYKYLVLPALIITGDTDSVVSPEIHSRTTAKEMQNAKLVVLNGAGHVPQHSRTDEVVREIRNFMEGQN